MVLSEAERAALYRERKKSKPFADANFDGDRTVTAARFLEAISSIDREAFISELHRLDSGKFTAEFEQAVSTAVGKALDDAGVDFSSPEASKIAADAAESHANEIGAQGIAMDMSTYETWALIKAFKEVTKLP